ncbi:hypothetical protein Sfulv_32870 [Streptomyces fulvorobeus]|uniref:Uncharacterized protein n=1 Tax=Streptomyces fulvorobeus TaxID=284028 RepID=A0A7J0C9S2_9ACTN|nr:hypothetical protein Sfulv_32870 [Streptomyces fulvorobeus]
MPEPCERPRKILSPARPVDLAGFGGAGEAGGVSIGVMEAMVFPVCVGERVAPLAAVHRMGLVAGRSGGVRRTGPPCVAVCC